MATTYLSPGVYVEEVDRGPKPIAGVSTDTAAFIGFAEKGPIGSPTLVTNWSQFAETFGGFIEGGYLAHSVYGYFNNGGSRCYVVRLAGDFNTPEQRPAQAVAALPGRGPSRQLSLRATACAEGNSTVTLEVQPPEPESPDGHFTLVVRAEAGEPEVYQQLTLGKSPRTRNAVEVVNRESRLIRLVELELAGTPAERAPAVGTYALTMAEAAIAALPSIEAPVFVGDADERTGLSGCEIEEDITMLCVPDLMAAYLNGQISEEGVRTVQRAMIDHCEAMKDRVAILDCLPGMSPQQIRDWKKNVANYDSKYAALYYPWVRVRNRIGSGETVLVPPSGHIAGIWSRNDSERGVHKAPANEVVRGVTGLEKRISRGEQDVLNPIGINCIREFPNRGIRVWGARTLSSDPAWTYINVRRLFNYVEKSIEHGTQWVVFEPNDMYLWEKVTRDISAFLTRLWRQGALFGASPGESFFVRCDSETNPPETRDVGQLFIEVGLAPVKPAEFVVFRIGQLSSGASVDE